MTTQFAPGQIVRTFPALDGSFDVFEVEGLNREDVIVRNIDPRFISETETWEHEQLELYEFKNKFGKVKIGDQVVAIGFEGLWTIKHFGRSSRNAEDEWCAVLDKPATPEEHSQHLFWTAHQIKKA